MAELMRLGKRTLVMIETIFQFDRDNRGNCQDQFRGDRKRDYYDGEYLIQPADIVKVRADKKAVGPYSIIRLVSHSQLTFRRSWRHIRSDGIDLTVLWLVKQGSIRVSAGGSRVQVARSGDILLTRSVKPFLMKCMVELEGRHEVMHVTVPTHQIRAFVPDSVPCGSLVAAHPGTSHLVRQIIDAVFDDQGGMSQRSAQHMVEAGFSLLGDAIAACPEITPKKPSLPEQRIEEILKFIDVHLGNPNLSTALVCRDCRISPRYLSCLLQSHGTSFTDLVWGQRMAKAREWLSSSAAREVPVAEVAHSLGFKSAAHFSRRFKQVYNCNPSDCRAA